MIEELQSVRLQSKNRDLDVKGLDDNIRGLKDLVRTLENKEREYKEVIEECSVRMESDKVTIMKLKG